MRTWAASATLELCEKHMLRMFREHNVFRPRLAHLQAVDETGAWLDGVPSWTTSCSPVHPEEHRSPGWTWNASAVRAAHLIFNGLFPQLRAIAPPTRSRGRD